MKSNLLFLVFVLVSIVLVSCSKREQVAASNNQIVGVWKSDSSIYEGYRNNVLVEREVDEDDGSEEETLHFLEDGTFLSYYVTIDDYGVRDTAEINSGTYTFNSTTRELVFRKESETIMYTVSTLNKEKVVAAHTHNISEPGAQNIDKEIITFFVSRIQ